MWLGQFFLNKALFFRFFGFFGSSNILRFRVEACVSSTFWPRSEQSEFLIGGFFREECVQHIWLKINQASPEFFSFSPSIWFWFDSALRQKFESRPNIWFWFRIKNGHKEGIGRCRCASFHSWLKVGLSFIFNASTDFWPLPELFCKVAWLTLTAKVRLPVQFHSLSLSLSSLSLSVCLSVCLSLSLSLVTLSVAHSLTSPLDM